MKFNASQLPLNKKAKGLSYEEIFLFASWFFGLDIGEEIHRYELFGFIQTNIDN